MTSADLSPGDVLVFYTDGGEGGREPDWRRIRQAAPFRGSTAWFFTVCRGVEDRYLFIVHPISAANAISTSPRL